MSKKLWRMALTCVMVAAVIFMVDCNNTSAVTGDLEDEALVFSGEGAKRFNVILDEEPLGITKYMVTYVAKPVRMADVVMGRDGPEPVEDVYAWQK